MIGKRHTAVRATRHVTALRTLQRRRVTATIEKAGGRIIGLWWTQGQYDAVTVIEWPDDQSASAAAIAMGMAGNVRTETLRAYTTDEFQRILQKLP